MQQRIVSCLCCRTRKIKCDKKIPCTQCVKSNNNNNCVYPCQGTLGRPPKNAVFYGKTKNNDARKLAIREFIFEHVGAQNNKCGNVHDSNHNISNRLMTITKTGFTINNEWCLLLKETNQKHRHLYTYFHAIYQCYLQRGLAIRDRFNSAPYCVPEKPRIKFNDLQLLFTWWISVKVNMMIKRNSILQLETNTVPRLTVYMFNVMDYHGKTLNGGKRKQTGQRRRYKCKKDETTVNSPLASSILFSSISTSERDRHTTSPSDFMAPQTHDQQTASDPLLSLPAEQAIHLIHDFFLLHPHSILINKTKLIKEYWSDTANPLLLAVIYGTTQCFSHVLQGGSVSLWESDDDGNRNPFLSHAHSLLKGLSTLYSVSDYKATVILGFFEVFWGFSKLGMSLLATSYLMGSQLGLWDKTFQASDPIEAELVNMAFWAVYRTTTSGCIECLSVADSLVCRDHIFPPMNIYESRSYQSDLLHHNIKDIHRYSYLIESFYSGAVVTHYSGFIHACLPKPYFNIYGRKTHVPTLNHLDAITQLRIIGNVETRVFKVLDDFNAFIQRQGHRWTAIQRYTIETTYRLYRIHFRFLQPSLTGGPQKYQEELTPNAAIEKGTGLKFALDPCNPDVAFRLRQVRSDILTMVDDLEEILIFGSTNDNSIKNNSNQQGVIDPPYLNQTALLPHDIMVSAFETSARLLMLMYQMDPSICLHNAMNKLLAISRMQDTYQTPSTATKAVRHRLRDFLKRHPLAPTMPQQQYQYNSEPDDYIPTNSETSMQFLFYLQPPNVVQHQQQPVRLHSDVQPPPIPETTAQHIFSPSSILPNSDIYNGNNTDYINTSTMDTTTPVAGCGTDTRWNSGNHQTMGTDDATFLEWNAATAHTLHPYGFASFLEQDQQYPGHLPS